MSRFDAIVIGGGINGLSAASVLARRGKSVCLLEQSETLGGMAAPGPDGAPRCAHLLYNLSPVVRADIGLGKGGWPFRTTPLPTVALAPDGAHVVLHAGEATLTDGSAHPDADAYRTLHDRLVKYGALLRQLAENAPPGFDAPLASRGALRQLTRLGWLGLGIKRMGRDEMRNFLRVLLSNAFDTILDEMPDGPMAGLLATDAVRGAAMGPRAPGTVFSLIYRMGHGGEATLPMGGMTALCGAFAGAARGAGCRIETGVSVSRLLIENGAVTGVETSDGRCLTAPLVLTSTGAEATCRLAGSQHFDIEAARRMRNVRARGTAAKVNLRLGGLPAISGLPDSLTGARMVVAPSAAYVERAFNPSKYREMSSAPVIEAIIPSVTDPTLAPDGGHLLSAIVQYAPCDLQGGWTETAKKALAKTAIDTLAAYMPDLPGQITATEVLTPADIEAETGAPGGHWHHAEMSLDQLLTLRPASGLGRYALGPDGLYLCGASAHPGGDIMGLAGRNAALVALAAEGRK
ncbi:phytoene desaturase family protein [Roseovarius pelagicus]|uniref:phytoene desaturase family protein n=1 Tax=Roseovarius pelagicus TaxID=2980108 RepID=UPI0027E5649E|nr:NAD(P)/FAD-dependent oxidoreductase [Roseovarius pelagicus]